MMVVTSEVVTEVVTGGNTMILLNSYSVTDLSGRVNQDRKQVVSADVTEMSLRWLRGNSAHAQNSASAICTATRAHMKCTV